MRRLRREKRGKHSPSPLVGEGWGEGRAASAAQKDLVRPLFVLTGIEPVRPIPSP